MEPTSNDYSSYEGYFDMDFGGKYGELHKTNFKYFVFWGPYK